MSSSVSTLFRDGSRVTFFKSGGKVHSTMRIYRDDEALTEADEFNERMLGVHGKVATPDDERIWNECVQALSGDRSDEGA